MEIFKKIRAKSSKENRKKGQIKTFVLGAIVLVNHSELLTPYPLVKEVMAMAEILLLKEIHEHATKVGDENETL